MSNYDWFLLILGILLTVSSISILVWAIAMAFEAANLIAQINKKFNDISKTINPIPIKDNRLAFRIQAAINKTYNRK